MLDFIKTYQTILGAIIAFLGVSWTLYWNAKVSRRLEKFKIEQQRIALLAALRAELAVIQSALGRQWSDFVVSNQETPSDQAHAETKNVMHPRLSMTVFEKNADKIGLLGVSLSADVVIAYSEVTFFEKNAATQSDGKDINNEEAAYSLARAFTAAGKAIERIKESLPKEEQRGLIMYPQPEVNEKDVKSFLECRKDRQGEQGAI